MLKADVDPSLAEMQYHQPSLFIMVIYSCKINTEEKLPTLTAK